MAASQTIIYLFAILMPLALVYCQDSSEGPPAQHAEQNADQDHHDRLFFSLMPRLTSCNYTAEAGNTCRNCRTALNCLSSGVGLVRSCSGLLRYCNQGRCSLFQGSACTATTSTSAPTTSSTTVAP